MTSRLPDVYEDDDENDEIEVERPKTPPRPREPAFVPPLEGTPDLQPRTPLPTASSQIDRRERMEAEMPPVQLAPMASDEKMVARVQPVQVAPMADPEPRMTARSAPVQTMREPSPEELHHAGAERVASAFRTPSGGRVLQMRPRKPVASSTTSTTQATVVPPPQPSGPDPEEQRAIDAKIAAQDAQRAAKIAAQAEAEARAAEAAITPEVIPRVPVRRRSNPFALLGVAAAVLFGAVALSMINESEEEEGPGDQDGDEPDSMDLPDLKLKGLSADADVIEGEILEDEEEPEEDLEESA